MKTKKTQLVFLFDWYLYSFSESPHLKHLAWRSLKRRGVHRKNPARSDPAWWMPGLINALQHVGSAARAASTPAQAIAKEFADVFTHLAPPADRERFELGTWREYPPGIIEADTLAAEGINHV